jgi:hypothetical protein
LSGNRTACHGGRFDRRKGAILIRPDNEQHSEQSMAEYHGLS